MAASLASLAVVYAAWMVTDPFLQAWTVQNRIPSPPPVHYLLAYSLVLPWAVLGLRRAVRGDWARWALPWGWALAIPVLVYLPHTLQRRFPEGSWTALSSGLLPALCLVCHQWRRLPFLQAAPWPLANRASRCSSRKPRSRPSNGWRQGQSGVRWC